MSQCRETLIDRMIAIYGLENPIVIQFAEMCEQYDENDWNNRSLELLVLSHEATPIFNED